MSAYCWRINCNCKYRDEEGCLFYYMGNGVEEYKPCYRHEERMEELNSLFNKLTEGGLNNGYIYKGDR